MHIDTKSGEIITVIPAHPGYIALGSTLQVETDENPEYLYVYELGPVIGWQVGLNQSIRTPYEYYNLGGEPVVPFRHRVEVIGILHPNGAVTDYDQYYYPDIPTFLQSLHECYSASICGESFQSESYEDYIKNDYPKPPAEE